MSTIYVLSGLGADHRVFQNIDFGSGNTVLHIPWLKPGKTEPLSDYIERLISFIKDPNPILIGLSFGGMIATEIARKIPVSKTIIISSVRSREEIPFYFKGPKQFKPYRSIPDGTIRKSSQISEWLFGVTTSDEKKLLASVFADSDPDFVRWAIDQIVNWPSHDSVPDSIHIHGSADRLFPVKKLSPDYLIGNGGHFMIFNQAHQINPILRSHLN